MNLYDKSSLILVPSGVKASKVYSQRPENGDGDFTFSRASGASRVNENGVLEQVASNVPRLDYTDSSCPSLLLEPQRTNLLLQSNQFDTSWIPIGGSVTSGQSGIYGSNDAWLLSKSATNGRIYQSLSYSGTNTGSVYAKAADSNWIRLYFDGVAVSVYFDLENGVVGSTAGAALDSTDIQSLGNGWYRCSATITGSGTTMRIYPSDENSTNGTSGSIYIQHAQLESGSYATSYIPTYGTAVTRNGPIINTGTSSANEIGQQSGVIYAEFKASIEGTSSNWLSLSSGSSNVDWIFIGKDYNKMRSYLRANSTVIFSNTGPLLTGDYQKVALRYENNNSAIFINGVKIAEYPSATFGFTQTLNRVSFGTPYGSVGEKTAWKQVLIFPTPLTDDELITLTTL